LSDNCVGINCVLSHVIGAAQKQLTLQELNCIVEN